jgi:hypothetical protein
MVGEKVNPDAEEFDRFACLACGSVIDLSRRVPKDEEVG